jgi:hypothetical protein
LNQIISSPISYLARKKQKKMKRKKRDDISEDFGHLKDEIRFGEVAERPPTLTIFPKSNEKVSYHHSQLNTKIK